MKLLIKNMVCVRCKMVVKTELDKIGLHYSFVNTGLAEIKETISSDQMNQLNVSLKKLGLELMDDKKSILIEKIKNLVIEMINNSDDDRKIKLSDYLTSKINYDYSYLTNLFSEVQGITIEHFYIFQKIERIKELIVYDELDLKEIAFRLHYSSVAHLAGQFKKFTGLTPSHFKQLRQKRRISSDNV